MKQLISLSLILVVALSICAVCEGSKFVKRDTNNNANIEKRSIALEKHWGYRNEDRSVLPKDWSVSHPKCVGKHQSPLDIESSSTKYDKELKEIRIVRSGNTEGLTDMEKYRAQTWKIANNGHSVVLSPMDRNFTFNKRPENQVYQLLQMHFHWRGSEHKIDGHNFAAEIHLVHRSQSDPNKFAVIGFLFRMSNEDNEHIAPLIESLAAVVKVNTETLSEFIQLERIVPHRFTHYYRYAGSLTTPGCDEVVEWFVVDNPVLTISEAQLLDFQTLQDSHSYPILTNVRPVQERNDRLIRRSFKLNKHTPQKSAQLSASGHTSMENSATKRASRFYIASMLWSACILFQKQ